MIDFLTEPFETTLTDFTGGETAVIERRPYHMLVHAKTKDANCEKIELLIQGYPVQNISHGIISESSLCKDNNYSRGDILFGCPCLVRTSDWHVIKLIEIDNTFWMIVGDKDPDIILSAEKSRRMWSNIDMNKWQNPKWQAKLYRLWQ